MYTHARLISMQDIVDGQYLEMIESCTRQSYQASSDRFQQGLLWKRATIADGSESVVCTGKGDGLMRACWSRRVEADIKGTGEFMGYKPLQYWVSFISLQLCEFNVNGWYGGCRLGVEFLAYCEWGEGPDGALQR